MTIKTLTVDYYHVRGTRADCLAVATYRGKRIALMPGALGPKGASLWAENTARAYGFNHVRFRDSTNYGQPERVDLFAVRA